MTSTQHHLRTFYTIVATQTMSIIGSQLSGLAIGYYVFAQTGQATPLLLVSLFGMLPSIFAANVGGMLADRWDRRKLMLLSDAGQALCTLLLLVSFASGSRSEERRVGNEREYGSGRREEDRSEMGG